MNKRTQQLQTMFFESRMRAFNQILAIKMNIVEPEAMNEVKDKYTNIANEEATKIAVMLRETNDRRPKSISRRTTRAR